MALLLLVLLAGAPDAGTAASWKVIYSTSFGSDVGNGVIDETGDTETVVTPAAVKTSVENTNKGKTTKNAWGPRPVTAAVREAITALLPRLPKENATFSISPYVTDEGWYGGTISWELDGKVIGVNLQQGAGPPPVSPEVKELIALVGEARKALK